MVKATPVRKATASSGKKLRNWTKDLSLYLRPAMYRKHLRVSVDRQYRAISSNKEPTKLKIHAGMEAGVALAAAGSALLHAIHNDTYNLYMAKIERRKKDGLKSAKDRPKITSNLVDDALFAGGNNYTAFIPNTLIAAQEDRLEETELNKELRQAHHKLDKKTNIKPAEPVAKGKAAPAPKKGAAKKAAK